MCVCGRPADASASLFDLIWPCHATSEKAFTLVLNDKRLADSSHHPFIKHLKQANVYLNIGAVD